MSATPKLISTIRDLVKRIQNGDGTGFVDLVIAAPADGSRLKALHVTSDDTAAQVLQIAKTIGGVDYILGEIAVPAGSGTDSASAAVNGLNPLKMPALQTDGISRWIDVANGSTIKIKSKVAVTAGKTIYISAEVGDFT